MRRVLSTGELPDLLKIRHRGGQRASRTPANALNKGLRGRDASKGYWIVIVSFGFILALISAQGDGSTHRSRLARTLPEAPMAPPAASATVVVESGDPLCERSVKSIRLPLPEDLAGSGFQSAHVRLILPVEGPSVLLPTLHSVPAELRADIESSDQEAEAWFRFFVADSRIPMRFLIGDPTGGHSYSDISSQEKVLNSTIAYRQIRIVRSMLLRFIHLWDDFVDMIDNKKRLMVDIDESPMQLMKLHESRIAEVWDKIEKNIQLRMPGVPFDSEPLLFGIRRTAFAGLMFSKDVPGRHFLRSAYKNHLLKRLPEKSRLRKFIETLNDTYVAYTAKVLLEAFDGPFEAQYPKSIRKHFRALSYMMELLYVPALVKQNETQEMLSGEIARRARLDDQTAGETLLLVMDRIKKLPAEQRAFVVRNLPLFVEKYEMILKKKKVRAGDEKITLFQIYTDFMNSPEIQPLVNPEVLYKNFFDFKNERSRVQFTLFDR